MGDNGNAYNTWQKEHKSLNRFLISLTNKKPKRLAITNGIMPAVKAIPDKSHLSAGSIASGCGICVLCVRYGIAK